MRKAKCTLALPVPCTTSLIPLLNIPYLQLQEREQNCNKNTREGWDVSYSFRAHTNSACASTQVLLHNRHCTQELKALWDSLGKEETKETLPQGLWSSHGVLLATGTAQDPTRSHCAGVEVTSCALLPGDPAQMPGQRSRCPKQVQSADPSCWLWRFQRTPCRLCHRAVAEKADGTHRLLNTSVPPTALPKTGTLW